MAALASSAHVGLPIHMHLYQHRQMTRCVYQTGVLCVPDRVDLWVGACAQAGRVCKPSAYAGRVDARVGCAKPGV